MMRRGEACATLRLAWRETRSAPARFLFVILAVAIGVASLTGVRGFSRALRGMLLSNARTLMAADLSLRVFGQPNAAQQAALDTLAARGARRTWITETVTMATSDAVREPLLVSLKAVDPTAYPYYGTVKLGPPGRLAAALNAQTTAVSEDLLIRLKTRVGESIRLGGQPFRVAAVLVSEPDRMTGSLNVGPRVMITREGLERTGLIRTGSRAAERYLFLLPRSGLTVEQARGVLKRAFPEGTIADFRETHPIVTRGLDRATTFLSLVSLIALIVGALGVGAAIDGHLRQKMDTIAILKCVGARSGQVTRIFGAQTLLLGAAGGLLGAVLGAAVERAFPFLLARFLPLDPNLGWDPVPALEGFVIGIAVTLLFTLPPLMRIRGIRPAVIFRREMAEAKRRFSWRRSRRAALAGVAILLGIGLVAAWLVEAEPKQAARLGAIFALGLAFGVAALAGAARLLLAGLRRLPAAVRLPMALRHGLANLNRPGSQAATVLVSLGIGVMFTLTVWLLQRSLVAEVTGSAPPGMPNVFLLDIPAGQRREVAEFAARQAGVERAPEVMASVAVRLTAVDGVPVEKLPLHEHGRRFWRTRTVTWLAEKPDGVALAAGAWWDPRRLQAEPRVSVQEEAAQILKVKPGAELDFLVWGKPVRARVAAIHRPESIRMAARFEFIFNPGVLEGFPAIYYGTLRVQPRAVAGLQRALYERYPTVTVINVADVLEIVQGVVDQIALVYRFISLFAIAAGAIILASAVAGTRFRRIREAALLKTLGATRRRVAAIFSVEFLVLGAAAGVMGSLLATGFTALVLHELSGAGFRFDPWPNAAAIAGAALIAAATGWLASHRILARKPLEALREE